jgi:two-component system response regulator AtoC/two-component system response regulator HupR/HoxA
MGDTSTRAIDVRLIMSVNGTLSDLGELVPELASRLSVFPVRLKPLRERPDDIRDLAKHFLRKYAQRNARAATEMSAMAVSRLETYGWPGNVRELENVVERAAILARGDVIEPEHLLFRDETEAAAPAAPVQASASKGLTLSNRLDNIERQELIGALEKYGGNKAEVARALGIHRTTLYYRLKKLGIDA